MDEQELIEALADKEHASWARWMDYLFSKCWPVSNSDLRPPLALVIPGELVARWRRQAATAYADLSEQEKQSDRDEVAHILPIIRQYAKTCVTCGGQGYTHDGGYVACPACQSGEGGQP